MDASTFETDEDEDSRRSSGFEVESISSTASNFIPTQSRLKPKFDAIFEEIQKNLPSIDDDIDDDDLLEPVEVFQHPIRGSLMYSDDDEKDLDESLSLTNVEFTEDYSLRHRDVNARENYTAAPNLASSAVPKDYYPGSDELETHGISPGLQDTRLRAPTKLCWSYDPGETSQLCSKKTGQTIDRLFNEPASHEFVQHPSVSMQVNVTRTINNGGDGFEEPDYATSGLRLSMNGLENVDFDHLLQSVVEAEYRTRSRKTSVGLDDVITETSLISTEDETGRQTSTPRHPSTDQIQLMEKLAALCSNQSGSAVQVDLCTGAAVDNEQSLSNRRLTSTGCSTEPQLHGGEAAGPVRKRSSVIVPKTKGHQEVEKETVFLDLRRTDSTDMSAAERRRMEQAVAQRVLGLHRHVSSDSSSSDDEDGNGTSRGYSRDAWFEQRKKIRESLAKGCAAAVQSGDATESSLGNTESRRTTTLSAIDAFRREHKKHEPSKDSALTAQLHTARTPTAENRSEACGDPRPEQKQQEQLEDKLRQHPPTERMLDHVTEVPSEHSSNACESERGRKVEAERLGKDKLEAEKNAQSRMRLRNNLEALRPNRSATGRQPCAEATPVVFDPVGSYARPVSSVLPQQVNVKESLLLSVYMSSNGEIVEHRSTMRSIDSGIGWPVSYLALLSWFASLIPRASSTSPDTDYHGFPFNVVGIQQMWLSGRLMLAVAIVPADDCHERFSSMAKKPKRKDGEQTTQFQQIVSKFLATHSLQDVCPWLQDCEPQSIGCACSQLRATYVYSAPALQASTKMLSTFLHVNPDPEGVKKVFGARVGFFWQTVDDHREAHDDDDDSSFSDTAQDRKDETLTQVTMLLVMQQIYSKPHALFAVLARTMQQGLDLAGVRLAFTAVAPTLPFAAVTHAAEQLGLPQDDCATPPLAVALRGTLARPVWMEELGPADPALARRTDPNSLMALYGGEDRSMVNLYAPSNEYKLNEDLAAMFGGRVPESGVINVGTDSTAAPDTEEGDMLGDESRSVAYLLTATVPSDIMLVISPLLPVRCYGIVISACQRRGYLVRGLRRKKLTITQAAGMGVAGEMAKYFASEPPVRDVSIHAVIGDSLNEKEDQAWSSLSSAILYLRKENAVHHAVSLVECFMVQLTLQGLLDGVSMFMKDSKLSSSHLFHVTPYTKHVLHTYAGGDFTKVPDLDSPAAPGYIAPRLHNNPELEQVVILALMGREQATTFGLLLADLLGTPPHQKNPPKGCAGGDTPATRPFCQRLELLGMKWLPKLSIGQAKELTPYEPGDREWKRSLQRLTHDPAVVLCLRGIRPHEFVRSLIEPKADRPYARKQEHFEKILSPTLEMAYRLASMFFFDSELFADDDSRPMITYLPPCREAIRTGGRDGHRGNKANGGSWIDVKHHSRPCGGESILKGMLLGPRPFTTLLVVKPSVVKRNNLARLFRTLFHEGFRLAGLLLRTCNESEASRMLPAPPSPQANEEYSATHLSLTVDYKQQMTSEDSLIICLMRENSVKRLLDILGPEDPAEAKKLDPFLWRGCYGTSYVHNGFYGSTSYATSVADIKLFFPDGLCCRPTQDLEADEINTMVSDRHVGANKRIVHACGPHPGGRAGSAAFELLLEVNCLLLLPSALDTDSRQRSGSRTPLLVDMLECLQTMNFSIVGAKLLLLTEEQARCYLHLVNAGSFSLVPALTAGPCIVLAVQRDNAVTTFSYLLQSGFARTSTPPSTYESQIMYPKDIETAKRLLGFFFCFLSPSSRWQIIEKDC